MITEVENILKTSPLAYRDVLLCVDAVTTGQAAVKFDAFKPGFPFEVVSVQHYAEALVANASYDVKIGTTSVLNALEVPVAATREDGVLTSTSANLRGSATDVINLHVTTDGSGEFTGLKVRVRIRAQGHR